MTLRISMEVEYPNDTYETANTLGLSDDDVKTADDVIRVMQKYGSFYQVVSDWNLNDYGVIKVSTFDDETKEHTYAEWRG